MNELFKNLCYENFSFMKRGGIDGNVCSGCWCVVCGIVLKIFMCGLYFFMVRWEICVI